MAREYLDIDGQARELILPLSMLKAGAGDFSRWSRQVTRRMGQEDTRNTLEDALSDVEERWIRTIDDYKFPVVTLSDTTNADAVCTIFETLNHTGVKLSPFELLTARFWPKGVNLRRLWATAQNDHPIITDFSVDPYYLLQIVSLAARGTPSCKRSDVLNMEASAVEDWWNRAVVGLARGLEILRDNCGVIIPAWLPYNTIVVPLAAVLAKLTLPGSPDAGAIRHKLVRWFWCSVFGQTCENAPNSQVAKDTAEVLAWCADGRTCSPLTRSRHSGATISRHSSPGARTCSGGKFNR